MAYRIIKNKPVPDISRKSGWNPSGGPLYPFRKMEVGDCFRVQEPQSGIIRTAASMYGMRHGKKFCVRKDESGQYFCWRTG